MRESYLLCVETDPDPTETSLAQLDDASLARRVIAGSTAAEAELCRRLLPRLRLYGRKHLREPHAAEDLAQQAMVLALERLRVGALREPEKLASFVFGICRMVVVDLRRTHARREKLMERFGDDLYPSAVEAAPRVDRALLTACLEQLGERERSILILTFYDQRQAAELATELGVSEGNLRVIRHRGLERVRRCMTGGLAA